MAGMIQDKNDATTVACFSNGMAKDARVAVLSSGPNRRNAKNDRVVFLIRTYHT